MTPDPAAFAGWLTAAFRDFKVQTGQGETLDALCDLQRAGALLLTTNYDSLLTDITGLPPVTWEEHAEFLQVMNRQRPGILHIHGHWQRPSSVVLEKLIRPDRERSRLPGCLQEPVARMVLALRGMRRWAR